MEWQWSKANAMDVAKFATDEALKLFDINESSFDLKREGEFERLLRAIYETLVAQGIQYDLEKESTSEVKQRIRTPVEIFQKPKQGTCLDLALLFSGLCLGYGLLPKLVMLEGHSIVAISLGLTRSKWDSNRDSQKEFLGKRQKDDEGGSRIVPEVFKDVELLKELIDDQQCCAIECTGFAWSKTINQDKESAGLQRNSDGYFSFDQAMDAGRKQLELLPFNYAIDIEVAQRSWGIEPASFDIPGSWERSKIEIVQKIRSLNKSVLTGADVNGELKDDISTNQDIDEANDSTITGAIISS